MGVKMIIAAGFEQVDGVVAVVRYVEMLMLFCAFDKTMCSTHICIINLVNLRFYSGLDVWLS